MRANGGLVSSNEQLKDYQLGAFLSRARSRWGLASSSLKKMPQRFDWHERDRSNVYDHNVAPCD